MDVGSKLLTIFAILVDLVVCAFASGLSDLKLDYAIVSVLTMLVAPAILTGTFLVGLQEHKTGDSLGLGCQWTSVAASLYTTFVGVEFVLRDGWNLAGLEIGSLNIITSFLALVWVATIFARYLKRTLRKSRNIR